MSIEILRSIRQAETEAEQIIRTSLAEARQMVSEVEGQSLRLLEQTEEENGALYDRIISDAEKEEAQNIVQLRSRSAEECDALKRQAGNRIRTAVELILERVMGAYGDS